MNLVKKKLEELKLSEYNPRRMREQDLQRLQESIMKFGYVEPIVWNKRTGRVVGGHQRLKALQNLGVEEVEVVEVDLDEGKEKALNLALNKIQGEWDEEKLSSLLTLLKKEDENILPYTGFNDKELAKIIKSPLAVVEDEIPETRETNIKTEDKFLLGDHVLLCGDATNPEHVKLLMDGEKADMVFTDPPYGVDYSSKNEFLNQFDDGNRIQEDIKGDTPDENIEILWKKSFANVREWIKPGSSYYITFSGDKLLLLLQVLRKVKMQEKQILVWVKNNHVLGRSTYHYKHEFILFGWKEGAAHNFYADFDTTVWEHDKPHKSDLHPTMKPLPLIVHALENSSKKGGLVLDVFGGSGSTLIACEQTGRKCKMMEISPEYCQVIIDRWEKLTGKKAQKVN